MISYSILFKHTFGTLILEYELIVRSLVSYGTISPLRICPLKCNNNLTFFACLPDTFVNIIEKFNNTFIINCENFFLLRNRRKKYSKRFIMN